MSFGKNTHLVSREKIQGKLQSCLSEEITEEIWIFGKSCILASFMSEKVAFCIIFYRNKLHFNIIFGQKKLH